MTSTDMFSTAIKPVLRARLEARNRLTVPLEPGQRSAAVALVTFPYRNEIHLMIIKRIGRGTNPGQWALPGGKTDGAETAIETAIRELAEETGLLAEPSDVIGRLDDFSTLSGFVITPVLIALTGQRALRRDPVEVASLHPIPINRLAAIREPRWTTGVNRLLQLPLRHDMVIHAPTGAILWQFAEVVLRGNDVHVSDFLQPDFTAR